MIFNLILIIFFIGGIGALWRIISEKIPELVAIPDEVIVARLHEDSAQVRIFLLHLGTFWREPRYQRAFWRFCAHILHRVHIGLMRVDNGMVSLLKRVRYLGGIANGNGFEGRVIEEERERVQAIIAMTPSSVKSARVQEVRRRKKEKMPE